MLSGDTSTGPKHPALYERMLIPIVYQIMADHIQLGIPTLPRRLSIEHISRPSSAATSQALRSLLGN